jgi:alkylation response protein AidB-like acyl-CoA dehydrogenase
MLMERAGHTGYALQMLAVARPSRTRWPARRPAGELLPVVAGERTECLAMTEPEAGSTCAGHAHPRGPHGADWVIRTSISARRRVRL